jgi:hypothetical protein
MNLSYRNLLYIFDEEGRRGEEKARANSRRIPQVRFLLRFCYCILFAPSLECHLRRYKVRSEIQKKQRDAESKQLLQSTAGPSNFSGSQLSAPLEKALTMGAADPTAGSAAESELQRLKDSIADKERMWRLEYEKLTGENEALRSRAGEAMLAAQWRTRYDSCLREKQELGEKLQLYTKLASEFNAAGSSSSGVDQAFADMQQSLQVKRFICLQPLVHVAWWMLVGGQGRQPAFPLRLCQRQQW